MNYPQPPGVSLLFCSRAEIDAAPAAEREAYYCIVGGLMADPESFGFYFETAADRAREDSVENALAGANHDWVAS